MNTYEPADFISRLTAENVERLTEEELMQWISRQEAEIQRLKELAGPVESCNIEDLPAALRGSFLSHPIQSGDVSGESSADEEQESPGSSYVSRLLQIEGYGVLESSKRKRKRKGEGSESAKKPRVAARGVADPEQLVQIKRLFPLKVPSEDKAPPQDLRFIYHPRVLYDEVLGKKNPGAKDEATTLKRHEVVLTSSSPPFKFVS